MDNTMIVQLCNNLLWTSLLLVGPAVLTSLAVGVIVSIFQTVTSIQEQTLSFAPRILAVGLVISLTLAWNLEVISEFTVSLLKNVEVFF